MDIEAEILSLQGHFAILQDRVEGAEAKVSELQKRDDERDAAATPSDGSVDAVRAEVARLTDVIASTPFAHLLDDDVRASARGEVDERGKVEKE